jgi:uncharacterized membrane protein YqjE
MERGRRDATDIAHETAEIVRELRLLARSEVELAKAELGDQAASAKQAALWGVAATVLVVMTLIFLPITLMFVFDTFMPRWAAAMLTTVLLAAGAATAGLTAKRFYDEISVVPRRTAASLREDVQWAREQLMSIVK